MVSMFYFAHGINIIFNLLLAQLVKYYVNTTRKIKFIHAFFITYYYYQNVELFIRSDVSILNVAIFKYSVHEFREPYYIENTNSFNRDVQLLYTVYKFTISCALS